MLMYDQPDKQPYNSTCKQIFSTPKLNGEILIYWAVTGISKSCVPAGNI